MATRQQLLPYPYPRGTAVYKIFGDAEYPGYVKHYDPSSGHYRIWYADGDNEEFDHHDVYEHLAPTNNNVSRYPSDNQYFPSKTLGPKFSFPIDAKRLRRSKLQPFHIIHTHSDRSLHILGATGNEYVVTFDRTIECSCPDSNRGCKHILFLLSLLGKADDLSHGNITVRPLLLAKQLQYASCTPTFQKHSLDDFSNRICTSHRHCQCHYCASPLLGSLLICSRCAAVNHTKCIRNQQTPVTTCPSCGRPYSPFHSPEINGYRNFYDVLDSFRYPVLSPLPSTKRATTKSNTITPLPSPVPTHRIPNTSLVITNNTISASPQSPTTPLGPSKMEV